MIEVFPNKIDPDKFQACFQKLVSALLMVAEDEVREEPSDADHPDPAPHVASDSQ